MTLHHQPHIAALFCIFIAVLLVTRCRHQPPEPPPGGVGVVDTTGGGVDTSITEPPPPPVLCDPDTVYFQQTVLPLLVSNCAIPGCHDPGTAEDGVVLTNYDNIIESGDVDPFDLDGSDLYEVITETDPDDLMPPPGEYPPLTSSEIEVIRTWILQGALNNSCEIAECDTTDVTYVTGIESILASKCTGCHSGANPQGGITLDNYGDASSVALFGNMLDAVQHTGDATPMPYNSPQLPECEIEQIRTWINNGAPQ